ncbi:hypothetical protein PRNP1_007127 [Phytophthora ramorum]
MDSETRQSDREASISADERRQVHDDPFKTSKKPGIVALKRKMDVFEDQMATIRARLEARRELASSQRDSHLPAVNCSLLASSTAAETSSMDRLKLPLLRQIERMKVANAPPKDPFLEVENVLHRTFTREIYVRDADAVASKELAVASATKEAQQLGEEARKRMVAYTQNESGWKFEERTTRYQQVMEMKQQAEKAQQEADLQRETVRQMKGLLRDPYGELRSNPVLRHVLSPVVSPLTTAKLRQKKEYEWIWILASPSTKLSFTPREETPDHTMDSEKELSMYVVYYIAGSEVNSKPVENEDQRRADKVMSGASEPPMNGIGLGCLKRHYFISLEEKAEMTTWVQTKESWLEKNVLTVIIEREEQMDRVHHLSRKCMVKYQQNLRTESEKAKEKLLAELNRIRFLTVKVLEKIDRWRQHARKIGFARHDSTTETANAFNKVDTLDTNASNTDTKNHQTEAPVLGWSSSITLETGKQLYKGSKAFVSKVKRFRRSEDINGKREQHIVYLGYFATQEEAERAYDEHAASEARLLNTTVEHLPRRRNVFRSCGKHFAVESEKDGPSFCIECKTKQLASLSSTSVDEWIPPFYYGTGVNYIMKMANDLDFLDDVLPLKAALNNGRGIEDETFPMRGNIFLLPKTPIQDPDLAVFTTFLTPTAPRTQGTSHTKSSSLCL